MAKTIANGPWIGHGTYLGESTLTASADVIKEAKLDWEVTKRPIYFKKAATATTYGEIARKYAIVKTYGAEETALGVVGSVFTPVQNERAFAYMDDVVTASKGSPKYYAAGELTGGKKVWILVDMHDEVTIADQKIKNFLLLSNGHDGLTTLDISILNMHTSGTTFPQYMSLTDKKAFFRFKHTTQLSAMNSKGNKDKVKAAIKSVSERFKRFGQAANILAGKQIDNNEMDEFLARVEKINEKGMNAFKRSDKYYDIKDKMLYASTHSLWDVFHSVAKYVDFSARSRNTDKGFNREEARLQSAWFGSGAQKKTRAFRIAIEMAGGDKSNLRELDIEEYGL
jgi:phage/plasmid-like protein (TIGR03299 family)